MINQYNGDGAVRQPNWKRWEVILLVDMYYRIKNESLNVMDECQKLSSFLRRSNLDNSLQSSTYRNVRGIVMKYYNIQHLVEGIGLSARSKLDVEIVDYYNTDYDSFQQELNIILSCS